jgi:hypothetical protein
MLICPPQFMFELKRLPHHIFHGPSFEEATAFKLKAWPSQIRLLTQSVTTSFRDDPVIMTAMIHCEYPIFAL